jgi:hypothetical protein
MSACTATDDAILKWNLAKRKMTAHKYGAASGTTSAHAKGSGSVRISVRLASGQLIHRTVYALYTPDLSPRSAQRIGRLLSVIWMQTHSGCEFVFPSNSDTGLLWYPHAWVC